MAVAGDLDSSEIRLSTGGCLTTSEFVCTTEQRDSNTYGALAMKPFCIAIASLVLGW